MVRSSELNRKNAVYDLPSITKLCVRREAGSSSFETLRSWLVRLAVDIFPLAVIAGGIAVQIWIQGQTGGIFCNILLSLSFLVELCIIWVWNRACVLDELRSSLR